MANKSKVADAPPSLPFPGGLSALPPSVNVAVQLIGTFGLAVFLVVFYVTKMHPQDEARYVELKKSIDEQRSQIEKMDTNISDRRAILDPARADDLRNVAATLYCGRLVEGIAINREPPGGHRSPDAEANAVHYALKSTYQDLMPLNAFILPSGESIFATITNKIQSPDFDKEIQDELKTRGWFNADVSMVRGQAFAVVRPRLD